MPTEGEILKNDEIQRRLNERAARKAKIMEMVPFVGLVFVFLFFLIATRGKLINSSNLSNLIEQGFTLILLTIGVAFIYAAGNMDFSPGNVMAVAELAVAMMMISGRYPLIVILAVAIGIGVFFSLLIGVITVHLKVMSVIASLCVINICTGILQTVLSNSELYIPYEKYRFLNGTPLRAAVVVGIACIAAVVFNYMRLGRELKAAGGNAIAARQSGINTKKVILIGFICSGICIGLASVFAVARTGVVKSTDGANVGLNALVALVLGGFPLTGGSKARISASIVGAMTVTILTNGISLLGIDPTFSWMFRGILYLAVVAISYDRSKGKYVA